MDEPELSAWCEIDAEALRRNVAALRALLAPGALLGVVVKGNAYGHGLVLCARQFARHGADWLIVNSVQEALLLRRAGIELPLYICAEPMPPQARAAVEADARVLVCSTSAARVLAAAARALGRRVRVHIKVETGTHRQGVGVAQALELARLVEGLDGVELEGISTHFADIEDSADPAFAQGQMAALRQAARALAAAGLAAPMLHAANSAAALLWPQMHASLVRVGIAAYGLWPSRQTYAAALERHLQGQPLPALSPALSWKARIAQLKQVEAGAYIGYGRTFRATHAMRIGIVPVGYFDGYDRRLSNVGHVLVEGGRAPVRGRVCMNMFMVDLTHIAGAGVGQVATLLGREGDEEVGADQWATWMGSINYEVVARIHPGQPRLLRGADGRLLTGEEEL